MKADNPTPRKAGTSPSDPEAPTSTNTARTDENKWTWILGLLFWIVLIAAFVVPRWWTKSADIVLEVSPGNPLTVSGVVLYAGTPVSAGYVQLTLDEPKTKRFLSSTVLPITNRGSFSTSTPSRLGGASTNRQLRITALFEGQIPAKDGKEPAHVSGDAVVYTNYSPPIGKLNLWSWAGGALLFMFGLMILFTGSMSRRKARCLFAVTYLCTFISLAVPLALILVVSQNNYLVEVMQESPVGLVRAKAKGVSDPQWLLNIGGIVQTGFQEANSSKELSTQHTAPAAETGASNSTAGLPEKSSSQSASPENRAVTASVLGGLAIPFYVIILAMFGAGINMTRRVPDIQKRYDLGLLQEGAKNPIAATLAAPFALFSSSATSHANEQQTNTVTGIRKEIIESYMGLLSAPFIAIAIYYVLQIIASSVAEPVLVLMAFATGLISDTVVNWIIDYAQKMLPKKAPEATKAGDAPASTASPTVTGGGGAEGSDTRAVTPAQETASTQDKSKPGTTPKNMNL